jgi:hypothetical protein
MKLPWLLLCVSGCALSFGPKQPETCYVAQSGERRCFANDEERRAAMSRDARDSEIAHQARVKRERAELEDRIRLRGAQQAARAAADEVERNEQEEFDLQVEMNEQARAMGATSAGASP